MTMASQPYTAAVQAYRTAARVADEPSTSAQPAAPTQGGFADLVQSAVRNAADVIETGERTAFQSVTNGGADLSTVVTAVAEAELTLQTIVAVRDKVLEAYREMIRMPV